MFNYNKEQKRKMVKQLKASSYDKSFAKIDTFMQKLTKALQVYSDIKSIMLLLN